MLVNLSYVLGNFLVRYWLKKVLKVVFNIIAMEKPVYMFQNQAWKVSEIYENLLKKLIQVKSNDQHHKLILSLAKSQINDKYNIFSP